MKVIGRDIISTYIDENDSAGEALKSWLCEIEEDIWNDLKEFSTKYRGVDLLPNNRIIFHFFNENIRLLALVVIEAGLVIIEKIGNVAESSKWTLK